jgi:hypothetical protein
MRKSLFLILAFILIALILASLTVGKTSFTRRILLGSFSSDSDTVWITRRADNWQDSIIEIGGCEQGVQAELWGCFYGDSGKFLLRWYYGHDPNKLFGPETLLDTSLASGDTIHAIYTVTNWKYSWGSLELGDSIDKTAGDSVNIKLIEYEQ